MRSLARRAAVPNSVALRAGAELDAALLAVGAARRCEWLLHCAWIKKQKAQLAPVCQATICAQDQHNVVADVAHAFALAAEARAIASRIASCSFAPSFASPPHSVAVTAAQDMRATSRPAIHRGQLVATRANAPP